MKLIITSAIISCLSILLSFSQDNTLTDDFKLEEVVQAESLSKEQLFQNAQNWILRTLKSSDNLIHLDDEQQNSIIATGSLMLRPRTTFVCGVNDARLNYKVTLIFKEGRYKYTIDNMIHHYVGNCGEAGIIHVSAPLEDIKFSKKKKAKIYDEVDQELKLLIASLKQSTVSPMAEAAW